MSRVKRTAALLIINVILRLCRRISLFLHSQFFHEILLRSASQDDMRADDTRPYLKRSGTSANVSPYLVALQHIELPQAIYKNPTNLPNQRFGVGARNLGVRFARLKNPTNLPNQRFGVGARNLGVRNTMCCSANEPLAVYRVQSTYRLLIGCGCPAL